MKTTILFISIILLIAYDGMSQDTIIMKSGDIRSVKIINRDRKNITFTVPPDQTVKTLSNESIQFIKMSGDQNLLKPKNMGETSLGKLPEWEFKDEYNKITSRFMSGMSDDEIAGELLRMGGENIKVAGICGFGAILLGITSVLIPQAIMDDAETQKNATFIVAGAAGALGIISIAELISGGNKIRKSGIVIQHKRFQLTATSMLIKL